MDGIGERLRERSRQIGLKDTDVARRCEVTQRRYSYYVNNQREAPFWFIKRACEVLSVDPNYLFGHDDDCDIKTRLAKLEEQFDKLNEQQK